MLLARDRAGALRPVALRTPEADALLGDVAPARRARSAHAVGADGHVRSGGDAVAPILAALGRPHAARVARLAAPWLLRPGYRAVAASRSVLGRLVGTGARARATEAIDRHAGTAR